MRGALQVVTTGCTSAPTPALLPWTSAPALPPGAAMTEHEEPPPPGVDVPAALPIAPSAAHVPFAAPSLPLLVQFHRDSAAARNDSGNEDDALPTSEAGSSSNSDDEAGQEPSACLTALINKRDAASRTPPSTPAHTRYPRRARTGPTEWWRS